MNELKKRTIAVMLLLVLALAGCGRQEQPDVPTTEPINVDGVLLPKDLYLPKDLIYMGGAPILYDFDIHGGPGDDEPDTNIVIRVPLNFVDEGFFSAHLQAVDKDQKGRDLLEGKTFTPGEIYTIAPEVYQQYDAMVLTIQYSCPELGILSSRSIDLLTLEDFGDT